MSKHLQLIAISMLCLTVASCAGKQKAANAIDPATQLGSIDVSQVIEERQPLWVNAVLSQDAPPLHWKAADTPAGLGEKTHAQQVQLGGYIAPNGLPIDLVTTLTEYLEYSRKYGQPPANAAEIVLGHIGRLQNMPSIPELRKKAPASLPDWFYYFVNPQTGKLYASFDGSVREPGGLRFHKLANSADAIRAFAGRPGGDLLEQGYTGWEIIVAGTNPDEILDTAVIMIREPGASAAQPGQP